MVRRKLIWQLFPSFLVVTLIALVAATGYFSYTFRQFHLDQTRAELRVLADVAVPQIAQALERSPAFDDVDALCKRFSRAGDGQARFTVVTPAGRVLGDSV